MHPLPHDNSTLVASIKARLLSFLFVFFLVFTLTNILFTAVGISPNLQLAASGPISDEAVLVEEMIEMDDEAIAEELPVTELEGEENRSPLPFTMIIDSLNRTLPINNPTSRSIADLDAALLTGVVRHPDSATMAQDGTVFILGHSSYLPLVKNKMFQAFNGIEKLVWGDTIRIKTSDREYVYQVDKVYKANANTLSVPIANTAARLTIATCDSFGSESDRFIVEAVLLSSEPLS